MKEAMFYEELEDKKVKCKLCPHNCIIKNNLTGICKVRKNIDGKLYSLNYGEITAINDDPIEKKPLFHFYPGEYVLSLGTWGCNFKCLFCQNFEISQERPYSIYKLNPEDIVEMAIKRKTKIVAFTYSEPIVWYEFVYDTAKLLKEKDIKTVLVTNGYINKEPLLKLIPYIDAMNIDLKGFNDEFYKKIIGGKKEPVMEAIKLSFENNIHIEVTTLVVTNGNDNENELEELFKWIGNISKDIPLHLSRYYPVYKYSESPTDIVKLKKIYNIATNYLNYVYLGNVWDENYESTFCPECGTLLINRRGYNIKIQNIDDKGRCKSCLKKIPIIF
ncbi:AmmeMemoRadiSam system radical SAM enzyme [Marinitoga aeolica]|uniref:AmmeMemoRadiSam system radical SAM enzyme n=1 Tax=Marinitoga aeolica TaxID=2809031 RepID=A0ABY8PTL4_9BACT|nr:AmmeMemoRadiSam system radical SAM enzyme [Marinitoga aeolica]WGS65984.1 AmmeMemoRadiSam system radical SAM enzyme [Marinitoga aeolica]